MWMMITAAILIIGLAARTHRALEIFAWAIEGLLLGVCYWGESLFNSRAAQLQQAAG